MGEGRGQVGRGKKEVPWDLIISTREKGKISIEVHAYINQSKRRSSTGLFYDLPTAGDPNMRQSDVIGRFTPVNGYSFRKKKN